MRYRRRGGGKADKPPRCTRELEQLMADEGTGRPGVANSDESPREDVGEVGASGISRSRGRSTTSSGREPCPTTTHARMAASHYIRR